MNSKAETIINESDVGNVFESVYTTIISNIQKFLGKSSAWIIDLITDHNINISKYNPLACSSYTKLQRELDHSRKGLVNIQIIDHNECLKWCLVRYLYPADHHPARTANADKDIAKVLDFEEIKFAVKIRDICKIEKKLYWHSRFWLWKQNKISNVCIK